MCSKKVEESTATGTYCTMHDVKVPFCMPCFSFRKIVSERFYVDRNKGESLIGYDMIIDCDLMVQLGISDNFE